MNFLLLLLLLLLLLALLSAYLPTSSASSKPNIIIYIADDFPYGALTDKEGLDVPNFKRLAKQGMQLKYSYSSAPMCSPSRFSLIHGRTIGTIPISHNRHSWPIIPQPIVIPHALKSLGYHTALIGKWLESVPYPLNDTFPHHPQRYGFDSWFVIHGKSINVFYPRYFYNGTAEHGNEEIEYEDNPRTQNALEKCIINRSPLCKLGDDIFLEEAIRVLNTFPEPFFLHWGPHAPHFEKFGDKQVCPTPYVYPKYEKRKDWDDRAKQQASAITIINDRDIGKILDVLETRKITNNTMVIFVSDNGTPMEFFTDGVRGGKSELFEGGLRSPSIISFPGRIKAGRISQIPTAHYDLALTLLDVANASDSLKSQFQRFSNLPGAPQSMYSEWFEETPKPRDGLHFRFCAPSGLKCSRAFIDLREFPNKMWKMHNRWFRELISDPAERNDLRNVYYGKWRVLDEKSINATLIFCKAKNLIRKENDTCVSRFNN